jgi:hypothetical protein
VSVASLRGVRCAACGFEGPAPPEIVARLEVAQRELARLDGRARQFDARSRAAIARAVRVRWGIVISLVAGALPFVSLAVGGVVMGMQHEGPLPAANRVAGIVYLCVPMILFTAAASILQARVAAARDDLLAAAAAVPPVRAGEAAACAMCGAPLVGVGVDPVARCRHCAADNVVHPSAIARASAAKATDLDALSFTLGRRSQTILATARRVTAATVALVAGTPFAAFFALVVLLLAAGMVERALRIAPSDIARYAWIDTERGSCVGMISREGAKTKAYFADNDRLPNPTTLRGDDAVNPRFSAEALVGQRVRTAAGVEGIVRRAQGAPFTNRETLVLDTGDFGNVAGACAAPR